MVAVDRNSIKTAVQELSGAKDITVDITDMVFDDLRFLLRAGKPGAMNSAEDFEKLLDLLDHCVVGGIGKIHVTELVNIATAVAQAIGSMGALKN